MQEVFPYLFLYPLHGVFMSHFLLDLVLPILVRNPIKNEADAL